jgi:hypothetical protein
MNIKDIFLKLTSRTYPHGTESEIFPLLGEGLQADEFGNLFIKIGESDVMFTAHLDTATAALTTVTHVIEGDIIKTDGKSILGADDKAGVAIMLNMIEKEIPGLYYFFLGEEVGCIGSRKVAEAQKENKIEGINKVISFDRRGNNSVITFQSSARCCSDTFGSALAKALNDADSDFKYENDDTGILTDSVQFVSIYAECTNISVGYQNEHTYSERQDIAHLTKLAEACLKVDWNSLPVERDPKTKEYKSYGSYGTYGSYGKSSYGYTGRSYYDDEDEYDYSRYNKSFVAKPIEKIEPIWFFDNKYGYVSNIEINSANKKVIKVDLCQERIQYEKSLIEDLLRSLDIEFMATEWDGMDLTAYYKNGSHKTECNRNELIELMPELDYSSGGDLGEYKGKNRNDYADNYGYMDDIWD